MPTRTPAAHSTFNIEHSTFNICISKLLGRKDHVLAEVGPRTPRYTIQIGVRLTDRLIHVHAQVGGDAADHVHRAFDFEIVADRRAVEYDLHVFDAPHFAELLVAEDRLVSE